jgi:hypothetical protein
MSAIRHINDSGRVSGSPALRLGKFNGTTYVTRSDYISEDFSLDTASRDQEFTDADDAVNGQTSSRGAVTGRATLQLASDATEKPQFGDVFKHDDVWYYINQVGESRSKGAEQKIPVGFRKVLTPSAFKVKVDGATTETSVNLTALTLS